jgi:dienelactone hydrolase
VAPADRWLQSTDVEPEICGRHERSTEVAMRTRSRQRIRFVVIAGLLGSTAFVSAADTPVYPAPATVRAEFRKLLDRPTVPLDPTFTTTTKGDIVEERGTFATEPGKRVPTLVVRQASAKGRLPTIVVLHGTGGNKEGMRDWLDDFAARGYLAVALDARYHGEWVPGVKGAQAYNEAAVAAWRSKPGEKREYPFWYDSSYDLWRAVDYLLTRPDVDPKRIGMLGFSMGGIQIWLAASVDTRVAAAVPIVAAQSMRWSLENNQWQGRAATISAAHAAAAKDLGEPAVNQRVARELWTKLMPGILDEFDCPSMIRLFAPRPLLLLSTENDQNCPLPGAKLAFAQAESAYKAAGAIDKLRIDVAPNARHELVPQHRELAMDWLDQNLKGR